MRNVQIVEWNFVSSFCTCVMRENLYSYFAVSPHKTTSKPSGSGGQHDCVMGHQNCGLNKKNKQRVYQGCQYGVACALEDRWRPFVFDEIVAGAACYSVLHDNTLSSISYLLLEVRVTVKGMVHHLVTTLTRKYSQCSFSRKIKK